MKRSYAPALILPLLAFLLSGCQSASLNWTPADAPKTLRVDTAKSLYVVSFAPGAVDLSPSETARLANYIAGGGIQPGDHVSLITTSADYTLAEPRRNHLTAALRRQGVGAVVRASSDGSAPDRVTVAIERSVVTLPDCPNWSKPAVDDTGQVSSNFGCANMTNLGLMIADPADLVGGRPTGPGDAMTTTAAIERYRSNQAWGSPNSGAGSTGAVAMPSAETAGSTGTHGSGGGSQ